MQNIIQKTYLLSSKEWQKKTLDIINKTTQNKNNLLICGGKTVKTFYRNIDIKKINFFLSILFLKRLFLILLKLLFLL